MSFCIRSIGPIRMLRWQCCLLLQSLCRMEQQRSLPKIARNYLQWRHASKVAPKVTSSGPLIATGPSELSFTQLKSHIPAFLRHLHNIEINFLRTETNQVIVYTDGSCLNNNTKEAERKSGIGVYWGTDGHLLNVSLPQGGTKLTNNRAEIAAAHAALILAKAFNIERLCLCTDSKNIVNACKYWLPVWEFNDWRLKSTDKPVANQDMWRKFGEDLLHVLVEFRHVTDSTEGIKKAHDFAQNGAYCSPARPEF